METYVPISGPFVLMIKLHVNPISKLTHLDFITLRTHVYTIKCFFLIGKLPIIASNEYTAIK